ncbi:MAG: hypothetical protein M5U01_28465 [Ardenticatenaceae bacterium]|nr:hypothetical protein [Ardenticatenaceae bacterium]
MSPYLTAHVKRFGNYVFDIDNIPEPLDLDTTLFPKPCWLTL